MTKREMLRSLIKATNSMIFSIHFVKKNGELREMVAKDGVEKHLVHPKGTGSNRQEHCSHLITLGNLKMVLQINLGCTFTEIMTFAQIQK